MSLGVFASTTAVCFNYMPFLNFTVLIKLAMRREGVMLPLQFGSHICFKSLIFR